MINPSLLGKLITEVDAIIDFEEESHVDHSILGASDFAPSNIVGVQVLFDAIKASDRNVRLIQD